MKAFELSAILAASAVSAEAEKAKEGLRHLSFALGQQPGSKTAVSVLSVLDTKLGATPRAGDDASCFEDIEASIRPLALLVASGGTKAAKEAFSVLSAIIANHGGKPVQSAGALLAPVVRTAATRTTRLPPPPNAVVVKRHVDSFRGTRPGTEEFTFALAELERALEEKRTKLTDLKAIAEELGVLFPGKTRASIMTAIAREHDTTLETLTKIRSGSNAA